MRFNHDVIMRTDGLWLCARLVHQLIHIFPHPLCVQVPPALAYGDKGLCLAARDDEGNCPEPLLVPPNEKLQFELQLLRVALDPSRL